MKSSCLIIAATIITVCSCKTQKLAWTPSSVDAENKKSQIISEDQLRITITEPNKKSDSSLVITSLPDVITKIVEVPVLKYVTVKIFYGTDRVKVTNPDKSFSYGGETTAPTHTYSVGYTTVTIPNDHIQGKIDKPNYWHLEFKKTPDNSLIESSIVALSNQRFDALLKTSSDADAFIFVHGFNNSFEDAALRTAQLVRDIDHPMQAYMFSWASNGKTKDYEKDGININLATPFFIDFIRRIAKNSHYKRIHIIAHSMGNRLVAEALSKAPAEELKIFNIDDVIMAAPDIDTLTFKTIYVKPMAGGCNRTTVYAAKNDWALRASNLIGGYLRLGQCGKPPLVIDSIANIDIIDAKNVKTDFLGHDRFAQAKTILDDMTVIFKTDHDAKTRKVPEHPEDGHPYYYFNREQ